MSKPNILFIFTDQMRGDSLGCIPGSPVITPNLDRLAGEGITFTRCQSNAPLCRPARAALMTGQLPRENGIWSNRSGPDPEGPSHVRNVRDAGYHTAIIGKTHLWRHSAGVKAGAHVKEMDQNLECWGLNYYWVAYWCWCLPLQLALYVYLVYRLLTAWGRSRDFVGSRCWGLFFFLFVIQYVPISTRVK